MDWKYDEGDGVLFTCTDSDWKKVGPVRCKVIRRLTDLEVDLCETGPMYEVMFLDMVLDTLSGPIETYHAFEDELVPIN